MEKQEYLDKLKGRVDELGDEIQTLKMKTRQFEAKAGEEFQEQLEELRAQRDKLAAQMKSVKAASGDTWEELRESTQDVLDALSKGLHETKERVSRALDVN